MSKRPLVSIVDDDESVRDSLPELLGQLGFAAQAFSSAEAFLASSAPAETDCLILDIAMPGISGPDLQLELMRRSQEIPIVFITAHLDDGVRRASAREGSRGVPVQALQREGPARRAHRSAVDEVEMRTTGIGSPGRGPHAGNSVAAARAIGAAATPNGRPIVFVVDDDVSVRESLELLLRTAGWSLRLSLPRGIPRQASRRLPCCLVLDVSLPGLNGLELQKQLPSARICRSSSSLATATYR